MKTHIKLDTGMNRIGIQAKDAVEYIKKAQSMECIDLKGIFSHLANAENEEKTHQQLEIWENILSQVCNCQNEFHNPFHTRNESEWEGNRQEEKKSAAVFPRGFLIIIENVF